MVREITHPTLARDAEMIKPVFAAVLILGISIGARAEDLAASIRIGSYTVTIKEGSDQPLCKTVLQTIKEVGEPAVSQCVPQGIWNEENPNARDPRKPFTGLNWAVIRSHLPPTVLVPDWQERNLSDPQWRAEATFLNTLLHLRDENANTWVSRLYSDAEIRQMTEQFMRDGTLPFDDGYDHSGQILLPRGLVFYQAEFEFREYQQIISRFVYNSFRPNGPRLYQCEPKDEYPEQSPIFFLEPNALEAGIVVGESFGTGANSTRSDLLKFDNELYHIRNPTRFLIFEKNLAYPEDDPVTGWGHNETCVIEILPNGA
jgi:hypothetical protein